MTVITHYYECTCGPGTRTEPDENCPIHNGRLRQALIVLRERMRERSEWERKQLDTPAGGKK
jgi:hypothetical protein